ncbi:hypothetical protein MMC14_007009, partial [Varicellaria rhodocarpa]|nr:hypothetical protein [Varicellaria rhodocarpa]
MEERSDAEKRELEVTDLEQQERQRDELQRNQQDDLFKPDFLEDTVNPDPNLITSEDLARRHTQLNFEKFLEIQPTDQNNSSTLKSPPRNVPNSQFGLKSEFKSQPSILSLFKYTENTQKILITPQKDPENIFVMARNPD